MSRMNIETRRLLDPDMSENDSKNVECTSPDFVIAATVETDKAAIFKLRQVERAGLNRTVTRICNDWLS